MARDFPDWINPRAAAEGRRTFQGTIPLQRFKRLEALLEDDASLSKDEVGFKARFALDEERRVIIDLEVDAEVAIMCQASLEPYCQVLQRHSRLGVIDDEAEMKLLPESYDPVLTENGRLAIQALVEEELLLALPQIPRNPALEAIRFSTGSENSGEHSPPKPNPFAQLRDQLAKKT